MYHFYDLHNTGLLLNDLLNQHIAINMTKPMCKP